MTIDPAADPAADASAEFIATDLHGHTLFSDGRTSPEEYVDLRARKKLQVIALSDHDTFAGVHRAARKARELGITLVPAMETTSTIHFGTTLAEQIHILAYFPPAFVDDGRLEKTFLHERSLRLAEKWKSYVMGFVARQSAHTRQVLGEAELADTDPADFPGLQTMINRIVERHQPTYFDFQLDHVHFWDDEELFGWSPEELIAQIRRDGGFDVVAHPVRVRDKARMDEVLHAAWGLEAYTSRHRQDIAEGFRRRAEAMGKHWTASSDDHQHGPYMRPQAGTPRATVERILRT